VLKPFLRGRKSLIPENQEKISNEKFYTTLMKVMLAFSFLVLSSISFSQIPKSGTYIFKYCDLEYDNSCYSTCRVVIKGTHITVYATKELSKNRTSTNEGDIIDHGIILKHESGKWIIGKSQKDKHAKEIGVNGPAILDFEKKQYLTF
jgi:hypothetical protein